jgi:hypothetical protein
MSSLRKQAASRASQNRTNTVISGRASVSVVKSRNGRQRTSKYRVLNGADKAQVQSDSISSQNIIPDEVMEMSDPHLVTEDSALQRSAIFEGISSIPKKKQSKVSSIMNFTYSDHLTVAKRHAP